MNNQESFFYKYRTIDKRHIDRARRIFTHNELYFSSKNQLNDPFDCKFGYSFAASDEEIRRYFWRSLERNRPNWNRNKKRRWIAERRDMIKRHDPELERKLVKGTEQIISEIGICSLTRLPDDILMWSHYADAHKGFCIKLHDDEKEWCIARAQKIKYSKQYPIVNPITDDDLTRLEKTLLTKSKNWEYEQEWRIIDHEKKPGIQRFPQHLLVGVIFGCRMSEDHKGLIREWCANRKTSISFYQAREASGTYSLDIIKI